MHFARITYTAFQLAFAVTTLRLLHLLEAALCPSKETHSHPCSLTATANRLLFPRSSDGDRHTAAGAQPSPALLKMLSWEQTPGCVAVTEALLRDNHSPSDGNKVAASVLQALRRLKRQRGVQSVDTRVLAHCISLAGTIRKVLLRAPHSTAPHPSNVKAIGASLLDAVTHLSCIRPSYGPKIGGALHGRNIDSYEGMYVSSQGCTLTASPASVHKAHLQQRLSLVLLATFVQERNRGVRALGSGNCTQRCLDCSDMGVKVLAMRAGLARSVFESMLLLYGSAHGDAQAEAEHGRAVSVAWESHAVKHFHGRLLPGCSSFHCRQLAGVSEEALPTKLCSGCRRARYCSVECQREAWLAGGHASVCRLPSS